MHYKTLIIGSGFAGLGMGVQLKRRGDDDFRILERADEIGGTWRDNTYPGAECDVPSHLYSFSFRMNPNWSGVFAPGPEIHEYLKDTAREEGIYPHVEFGANVTRAEWDDAEKIWRITTTAGDFTSKYLITGTGHLADEKYPIIPGLDTFTGPLFHSARWDHSADLTGKRIGIVGTGATAIQLAPKLQEVASELVVFQRTPAWVIARPERPYSEAEKGMFARMPETMQHERDRIFWGQENTFAQRRGVPAYLEQTRATALAHMHKSVEDPELREKLTPDYEPGCKRLLLSNTYYPAMAAENVTVEASALQEIQDGVAVAASGEKYELDVLVFATGFEATEPPYAELVYGKAGQSLSEKWQTGMYAMDSSTVSEFPNMFSINGPNTSLGHNSIVYIIESQIEYILEAMDYIESNDLQVLDALPAAEAAYLDEIEKASQGTVWTAGGCKSWYVDQRSGKLTLIWPDFGFAFRDENGSFHPEKYSYA